MYLQCISRSQCSWHLYSPRVSITMKASPLYLHTMASHGLSMAIPCSKTQQLFVTLSFIPLKAVARRWHLHCQLLLPGRLGPQLYQLLCPELNETFSQFRGAYLPNNQRCFAASVWLAQIVSQNIPWPEITFLLVFLPLQTHISLNCPHFSQHFFSPNSY